ncbi:MAG: hypothetical protein KF772_00295 [Cryobacterium sp.]|nr:hypothetical protein [Cryobacterium sp.]MBX3117148.1 hypothetical protein [Cryobacterium sp.]MCO5294244.1 hypothetical protein [Homoserinimonas sp.]
MTTESGTRTTRRELIARGLKATWLIVRDLFDHVLAEPIRDGRIRSKAWPLGLKTIVAIAIIGYAVAVSAILFSGWIRQSVELTVNNGAVVHSFPRAVLWVILFLVALAISLLQTAVLHVSAWLAWLSTGLTALILVFVGAFDTSGFFSIGHIASFVSIAGLVALLLLRRRHRFAWWEFVVVLLLISGVFAIGVWRSAELSAPTGIDFAPGMLSLIMFEIGQLAVPAAIAAGLAVAEISTSTALWAIGLVRRRLPAIALWIGLGLIVLWRIWSTIQEFLYGTAPKLPEILSSLVLIGLIVLLWLAFARLRSGAEESKALGLVDRLGSLSIPIAAMFSVTLVPLVILMLGIQIVMTYGVGYDSTAWVRNLVAILSSTTSFGLLRLIVGIGLIAAGFVLAKRGKKLIPEIFAAVGVVASTMAIGGLAGLNDWFWTGSALTLVVTSAGLIALVWAAIVRKLTVQRASALAVILLVASLFNSHDFISDPLSALLGFTGAALVLFGFVWSFLTDGDYANETSRKYPRSARVLLYLASSVFGVTVLAFTSLSRNPDASINLGDFAGIGDQLFGTALMVAVILAMFSDLLGNRQPVTEAD